MFINQAIFMLLGAHAILAARNEFNVSAITQILKLLTNLGADVLVARVKIDEMTFESIDFVERESALAERLDALHHIEQPAARFQRLVPEEEGFLPFFK